MKKDKRYLLFGYDRYYPAGGMWDLIKSYDTIPEAIEEMKTKSRDNYNLYDRIAGLEIIDFSMYGLD